MEQLDPAGTPIAVLLGTATNVLNGPNLATPTLWMDPVRMHVETLCVQCSVFVWHVQGVGHSAGTSDS